MSVRTPGGTRGSLAKLDAWIRRQDYLLDCNGEFCTMASKPKSPRDLRGEFIAIHDIIAEELSTRPGADSRERARQGAWDTILKQRAPESRRRCKDIAKARRWEFASAQSDVGIALVPSHWDHVIRQDFNHLYVRLAGALRQYYSVRVVWRPKIRFGIIKGTNAPVATSKAIAAQRKAAEKTRQEKAEARNQAYKDTLKNILADFAEKRAALHKVLEALVKTMDGLMRAEESRLRKLISAAPRAERPKANQYLAQMKQFRLDAKLAKTISGEKSSVYTGLVGKWNGARRKTARVLA